MPNPFTLKVISHDAPFCNRQKELKDLARHAVNKSNVVIFSPRRYGKTSLVKRVQHKLQKDSVLAIYVDLFGLSSTDDIAGRIARSIYKTLHGQKTVFEKAVKTFKSFRPVFRPTDTGVSISIEVIPQNISGIDLLEKTMEDLGNFISQSKASINVVLDEFQEIVELKDPKIEGILRKHIQEHQASYFFVGSRRRILLEMFTSRKRPFYQSAFLFKLEPLPIDEFATFLKDNFEKSGKTCTVATAKKLSQIVGNHPLYAQKLAYLIFESPGKAVTKKIINEAYQVMIEESAIAFEAVIQGLAPKQIALLQALAKESSSSVLSMNYMQKHKLKSIGGIQAALKKLSQLDLIEKTKDNVWRVVDPVFADWLKGISAF